MKLLALLCSTLLSYSAFADANALFHAGGEEVHIIINSSPTDTDAVDLFNLLKAEAVDEDGQSKKTVEVVSYSAASGPDPFENTIFSIVCSVSQTVEGLGSCTITLKDEILYNEIDIETKNARSWVSPHWDEMDLWSTTDAFNLPTDRAEIRQTLFSSSDGRFKIEIQRSQPYGSIAWFGLEYQEN